MSYVWNTVFGHLNSNQRLLLCRGRHISTLVSIAEFPWGKQTKAIRYWTSRINEPPSPIFFIKTKLLRARISHKRQYPPTQALHEIVWGKISSMHLYVKAKTGDDCQKSHQNYQSPVLGNTVTNKWRLSAGPYLQNPEPKLPSVTYISVYALHSRHKTAQLQKISFQLPTSQDPTPRIFT